MFMSNILRIIKLKEISGELDNLTSKEKLFFKLHQNLHENELGELCNENEEWVVVYDIEYGNFWYHYDRFYLFFKKEFDVNINEFNELCKGIMVNTQSII